MSWQQAAPAAAVLDFFSLPTLDGIDLNLVELLPLISQVIPVLSFRLVMVL